MLRTRDAWRIMADNAWRAWRAGAEGRERGGRECGGGDVDPVQANMYVRTFLPSPAGGVGGGVRRGQALCVERNRINLTTHYAAGIICVTATRHHILYGMVTVWRVNCLFFGSSREPSAFRSWTATGRVNGEYRYSLDVFIVIPGGMAVRRRMSHLSGGCRRRDISTIVWRYRWATSG